MREQPRPGWPVFAGIPLVTTGGLGATTMQAGALVVPAAVAQVPVAAP